MRPLTPPGSSLFAAREGFEARMINGTYTRDDVAWLVESIETLAAELNELVEVCLREHRIAYGGPRAGQMVHLDCEICDWLASHPRAS